MDDLAVIIHLAKQIANGSQRYYPGLEKAFARTIVHMNDHWQPRQKVIKHTSPDGESRIKP